MRSDRLARARVWSALGALLSLAACADIIGLGDTPPAAPGAVDGGEDARALDATTDATGTSLDGSRDDAADGTIDAGPATDAGPDGAADADVDARSTVDAGGGPVSLALQFGFGCARFPSGVVECWGDNARGAQAVPLVDGGAILPPHVVVAHVATLGSGQAAYHECVGLEDGAVACWGANESGQAGLPGGPDLATPTIVPGISHVASIAVGQDGTCAVKGDRSGVICWASSGLANQGLAEVGGVGPDVQSLGAGEAFECAIVGDGGVLCWGDSEDGRLGIPVGTGGDTPVTPRGVSGVADLAVGWEHVCAALKTGRVMCWGLNKEGEVGIGSADAAIDTPTLVPGLTDIVQVVAGASSTCALHDGGTVSCWGWASAGATGLSQDTSVPQTVTSLSHVRSLAAGRDMTCAILDDAGIVCWGGDDTGQRGDGLAGDTTITPTPLPL